MGAACWYSGHRGVLWDGWGQGPPAALRVAWRGLFLPTLHTHPSPSRGPQGRWEQGDPLSSPLCISWAWSSPINRLPGVRGIELPDLCPARSAPSASLSGFVGPRPGRLLAPDGPCGCRGDRFRLGHYPGSLTASRPQATLPPSLSSGLAFEQHRGLLLHKPGPSCRMPPKSSGTHASMSQ